MEIQSKDELRKLLATAYTDGSSDEVIADLEAKLATAKIAEAKAKAETEKAEVLAFQGERAKIVESVDKWVKSCEQAGLPMFIINQDLLNVAFAIVDLYSAQPDILDQIAAARGLGLQYKPPEEGIDNGRALVLTSKSVTPVKTKTTRTGETKRHGKRQEMWSQYATVEEQTELADALAKHKAECDADTSKKHRPDSVTYKYQMKLLKRLISSGIVTAEE